MNRKNAFYFIVSLLLTCGIAVAQTPAPPPTPDAPSIAVAPGEPATAFSLYFTGGSFLGVHTEDINNENMGRYGVREARGVGITQVAKDSPAEKAGLRKDDVILRFEGDSVTSVRKLTRLVSEVAPDQSVRLSISRGGSEQEVAVTMGKRKNAFNTLHGFEGLKGMEGFKSLKELQGLNELKGLEGLKSLPPGNVWRWEGQGPGGDSMVWAFGNSRRIGVSTMQLTKQLADYFEVAQGSGVLVTSVADDSPAAKAGVKAGDVITAIDGEKVDASGDVSRAINKKKDGDVTLTIIRKKDQRTITVTPKAAEPGATPRVRGISGADTRVIRTQIRNAIKEGIKNGEIVIPVIPQINVTVPNVRVIRSEHPI